MPNIVTEDKITHGDFQKMGLLGKIYSLGYIEPMDMASKKNPYEDYPSYREAVSGYKQESWREESHEEVDGLKKIST